MKVAIACNLRYFKVSELQPYIKFGNYFLVDVEHFFLKEFNFPRFIQDSGIVRLGMFFENPYFFKIINDDAKEQSAQEMHELTADAREELSDFMFFLWFIKDNCASVHEVFYLNKTTLNNLSITNYHLYSEADGQFFDQTFTEEEINETILILEKYKSILRTKFIQEPLLKSGGGNSVIFSSQSRIDRAMDFLEITRGTRFLPLKISFYMSVFECLFTTDATEVSHKVAERVAIYSGGSYKEKIATFKLVKKAYNIRSKYFHGQELDKQHGDHAKHMEISKMIDVLTRKVLKMVILVDHERFLSKGTEAITDWFNELLFSSEIIAAIDIKPVD